MRVCDDKKLLKEWDFEKNSKLGLDPNVLLVGSNKIAWWICEKGHSYDSMIQKRAIRNQGCPYCSGHRVLKGFNDIGTVNPAVAAEWDYEKNGDFLPENFSSGSSAKVWWKCPKCHESYQAIINNRTKKGSGCPYCANLKVAKGKNDFLSLYPTLALEWDYEKNGNLKPDMIVPGYFKKVWWKCPRCKNSYQASPRDRIKGRNCPYCCNNKIKKGFNDLQTKNPELAKQWDYDKNYPLLPSEVGKGSERRVWWKCKKGHSWKASIVSRNNGMGCPICSNHQVLLGYNDLCTTHPDIAQEWDYDKNFPLKPTEVTFGSNKKVWWKCSKCGSSWQAIISSRKNGPGCRKCSLQVGAIKRLKTLSFNNHLFDKFPLLLKEWNFEKNKGIDVDLLTPQSNKKVWWKCKNGHEWQAYINARTGVNSSGCPYCHNQKVLVGINDLETINPLLAKEWNYDKNGDKKPSEFFPHAHNKVWWKCSICGHEWEAKIQNRSNGRGCPNCSLNGTSFVEQAIFYYIKKSFPDALNRLKLENCELDIFIPSKRIAIEYDGYFYHSIKNSENREIRKDRFCKDHDISLIRLREKPLAHTKDAINLSCDTTNWEKLTETIIHVLNYLGLKGSQQINIQKDYSKIITSRKQLIKENSLAKKYPELLKEWDCEKNQPLNPEYFSPGSDVRVWWKCSKCGHSWQTAISNRAGSKTGCPNCFNERRKKGLHRTKQRINKTLK